MKKAKIVLSAIAVFAVIGGAFAFKASRTGAPLYYLSATNPATTLKYCVAQEHYNTLGIGTTTTVPTSYYTTRLNPIVCNGLTYTVGQTAFFTGVE